jgi:ABC-2 type transport system permease protein
MGVGEILIDRLIYLLTFALFIMLVFSNTVISFQLYFQAKETAYLQTLPLPRSIIFRFLLMEGVILSTWATIFLIFPVVLAYGVTHKLSLYAYISLPIFAAGLAFLAALIGVLIASLIPGFLTSARITKVFITIIIILAFSTPLWSNLAPVPRSSPNRKTLMINRLLEHSRITLSPIFPGYWAAEGFIQGVKGRISRSLGFLAVLTINLLLAWQIVELTAERYYRRRWSLYHSRGGRRKKKCLKCAKVPKVESCRFARQKSIGDWEKQAGRLSPPYAGKGNNFQLKRTLGTFNFFKRHFSLLLLPSPSHAILIKDLKTFLREPAQWLQAMILFGLLTIYILNIKNMPRNVYQTFWKNLITFFNLGAASLILATLTTRFVYPSFSLEGRTFWVLGLAPIRRATLFRIKFWSNFAAAVIVTVPLMLLSNHILEVSGTMTLITCGVIVVMAGVLVSLATGLGAIFPQFNEDNPSRIASGFGGTLNLILSLIYIAVMVCALAIAYHVRGIGAPGGNFLYPVLTVLFVAFLSILGIYFLFKLGIRALERVEF